MDEQDIEQPTIDASTFEHGKNGYFTHKCRCDMCIKAEAKRRAEYKKKRFNRE